MELYIDTAQKDTIILELRERAGPVARFEKQDRQISEHLLGYIDKFLKKNKIKLRDLRKIKVNRGPGPFSAVRSGVATANALNFALGLDADVVLPEYDREPNITKPKNK